MGRAEWWFGFQVTTYSSHMCHVGVCAINVTAGSYSVAWILREDVRVSLLWAVHEAFPDLCFWGTVQAFAVQNAKFNHVLSASCKMYQALQPCHDLGQEPVHRSQVRCLV